MAQFRSYSGTVEFGATAVTEATLSLDTAESSFKGVSVKSRGIVTIGIQRESDHWTLRVTRDHETPFVASIRGKWVFPAVRYQVSQSSPNFAPLVSFISLAAPPAPLFSLHLLRPHSSPVSFPLSFRRPITFADSVFSSADFSIFPAGNAFSLGVLTIRLHTDGLRGFGFAVPPVPATFSTKFPPFAFYDFENGGFVGGAAVKGSFPPIRGETTVIITADCELGYLRFIMNDVLVVGFI